jgi:hypothetical protein
MLEHPNPVTKDCASRQRARRIDRDNGNGLSASTPLLDEGVDKCALPAARRAGDSHDMSPSAGRVKLGQQASVALTPRFEP